MRQCQLDSYLRDSHAMVIDTIIDQNGKHWVRLDSTLFYSEAGGQPADHGQIGSVKVIDVQRKGDEIWHQTEIQMETGAYPIAIDWKRRFDHMQQHTGQHMLTALILERFEWMTLGFQLGTEYSTIELDTPSLDRQICLEIEAMANDCILNDKPVRSKLVDRSELDGLGVRTRGLPDYVNGPIRLIEIEGLDLNTCGGTHVRRTGELQLCKILGTESIRGRTRLQFIFGARVLRYCEGAFKHEQRLNKAFGQGREAHVELIEKWQAERKVQTKTIARLENQLIDSVASKLNVNQGAMAHHEPNATLDWCARLVRKCAEHNPNSATFVSGHAAFVIYDPNNIVSQNRATVLGLLEGRGGGRPPMMQGKCERPGQIKSVADWYRQTIASG